MKLNWICGILFAGALTIPLFGANFSVYWKRTTSDPLRAARADSRSGLRLGRRVLGPTRASLSLGGRPLGPFALCKEQLGTIPTMITTGKAGNCMKATGIMTTTTVNTDMTAITS
jgi:hypothetical protein